MAIAAVVKVWRITGALTTVSEIVTQVHEAFGAPYFDHVSSEPRHVHRCMIVTNDEITKEGDKALRSALKSDFDLGRVALMDIGDLEQHRSHGAAGADEGGV